MPERKNGTHGIEEVMDWFTGGGVAGWLVAIPSRSSQEYTWGRVHISTLGEALFAIIKGAMWKVCMAKDWGKISEYFMTLQKDPSKQRVFKKLSSICLRKCFLVMLKILPLILQNPEMAYSTDCGKQFFSRLNRVHISKFRANNSGHTHWTMQLRMGNAKGDLVPQIQ